MKFVFYCLLGNKSLNGQSRLSRFGFLLLPVISIVFLSSCKSDKKAMASQQKQAPKTELNRKPSGGQMPKVKGTVGKGECRLQLAVKNVDIKSTKEGYDFYSTKVLKVVGYGETFTSYRPSKGEMILLIVPKGKGELTMGQEIMCDVRTNFESDKGGKNSATLTKYIN